MKKPQRYGTFAPHQDDEFGVDALARYATYILNDEGRVYAVWIFRSFTDSELPLLANLPCLECLGYCGLSGSTDGLTADGVVVAFEIVPLSSLVLQNHDGIDDDSVAQLALNPRLRELRLYNTRVTDRGIAAFGSHAQLRAFAVSGNHITNSTISPLCQHANLATAYFDHTSITDDGVRTLQEHLPQCRIKVKR